MKVVKLVTFDLRPGSLNAVMSCGDWIPVDHRPPLPRIETAPQYTPAPLPLIPEHIQVQIDHAHDMQRRREGERIWELIVEASR